jgi:hypothetical protein
MRKYAVVFVLPLLSVLTGCIAVAAAGAATAGVLYVKGVAQKTYPYPVERTYGAAIKALEQSGITVFDRQVDATSAKIEARLASDKKLIIDMKAVGDNATEVNVRVGTWGDRDQSQYVFSQIDKQLR